MLNLEGGPSVDHKVVGGAASSIAVVRWWKIVLPFAAASLSFGPIWFFALFTSSVVAAEYVLSSR